MTFVHDREPLLVGVGIAGDNDLHAALQPSACA
jgi:hypothetical protein